MAGMVEMREGWGFLNVAIGGISGFGKERKSKQRDLKKTGKICALCR